jgi:hypothetical protein
MMSAGTHSPKRPEQKIKIKNMDIPYMYFLNNKKK